MLSPDGKGAWRDNVFVERLWRTIEYEEVDLLAYDCGSDARQSIGRYLDLYNRRRPHSSLDGRTRPIKPTSGTTSADPLGSLTPLGDPPIEAEIPPEQPGAASAYDRGPGR